MQQYQIEVVGELDGRWSEWLGGMAITTRCRSDGRTVTILTGPLADQAALYGVLARIHDLNLELISLQRLP